MQQSEPRRRINTRGYVEVQLGNGHPQANAGGWRYEHRRVMEGHLERRLKSYEEVHHLDGDRANNTQVNLELIEKVDHSTYHAVYKPRDVLGRFKLEEGDLDIGFLPSGHAILADLPF